MATKDVPGANKANNDELKVGAWAEHKDGSLLFVKGLEGDTVVFELYELQATPPFYYQDAMPKPEFEKYFSRPPVGISTISWTWHDKKTFPWDRVMKRLNRPTPVHVDVEDQLSAARKVADSLNIRGRKLSEREVGHRAESERYSRGIFDRLERAFQELIR